MQKKTVLHIFYILIPPRKKYSFFFFFFLRFFDSRKAKKVLLSASILFSLENCLQVCQKLERFTLKILVGWRKKSVPNFAWILLEFCMNFDYFSHFLVFPYFSKKLQQGVFLTSKHLMTPSPTSIHVNLNPPLTLIWSI